MGKKVFVIALDLCSGCKNCELWCSIGKGQRNEFNTALSKIKVVRDEENAKHVVFVDCDCELCVGDKDLPICVEMCPTGTIAYTEIEDACIKRRQLNENKRRQPIFKLIAPWKYPYPWTEYTEEK